MRDSLETREVHRVAEPAALHSHDPDRPVVLEPGTRCVPGRHECPSFGERDNNIAQKDNRRNPPAVSLIHQINHSGYAGMAL